MSRSKRKKKTKLCKCGQRIDLSDRGPHEMCSERGRKKARSTARAQLKNLPSEPEVHRNEDLEIFNPPTEEDRWYEDYLEKQLEERYDLDYWENFDHEPDLDWDDEEDKW